MLTATSSEPGSAASKPAEPLETAPSSAAQPASLERETTNTVARVKVCSLRRLKSAKGASTPITSSTAMDVLLSCSADASAAMKACETSGVTSSLRMPRTTMATTQPVTSGAGLGGGGGGGIGGLGGGVLVDRAVIVGDCARRRLRTGIPLLCSANKNPELLATPRMEETRAFAASSDSARTVNATVKPVTAFTCSKRRLGEASNNSTRLVMLTADSSTPNSAARAPTKAVCSEAPKELTFIPFSVSAADTSCCTELPGGLGGAGEGGIGGLGGGSDGGSGGSGEGAIGGLGGDEEGGIGGLGGSGDGGIGGIGGGGKGGIGGLGGGGDGGIGGLGGGGEGGVGGLGGGGEGGIGGLGGGGDNGGLCGSGDGGIGGSGLGGFGGGRGGGIGGLGGGGDSSIFCQSVPLVCVPLPAVQLTKSELLVLLKVLSVLLKSVQLPQLRVTLVTSAGCWSSNGYGSWKLSRATRRTGVPCSIAARASAGSRRTSTAMQSPTRHR